MLSVYVVYSDVGMNHIHQVTWIPLTEYAVVFALAAVVCSVMKVSRWFMREDEPSTRSKQINP